MLDPNMLMSLFGYMFGGGQGGGTGGAEMPPTPPVPYAGEASGVPTAGIQGQAMQPPIDSTTGMPTGAPTMPNPAPMSARPPVNYGDQSQTMGSLGEALVPRPAPGTPLPMSRPPGLGDTTGSSGGSPGYYGGSPETNPNLKPITGAGGQQSRSPMDIAKLLGGIKAPAGPDVVKPSTPAQPVQRAPGASELLQLLMSLGMGGKSLRGPTTLGQALENRPSAWGGLYG